MKNALNSINKAVGDVLGIEGAMNRPEKSVSSVVVQVPKLPFVDYLRANVKRETT